MHEVSVTLQFSAAHNLRGYRGQCEALHGHNWKVEVSLAARTLDKLGMVADFKVIKGHLKAILAPLDHAYLNNLADFKKINPTSEHIARLVFEGMRKRISAGGLKVSKVRVWETDNSCATYSQP